MSSRCIGCNRFVDSCGSGLSGQVVEEEGHYWVGLDISEAMLEVAKERADEGDISGDVMLCDAGEGMPFRAGSFDGAISISALQWLCNADKSTHRPAQRLYKLFSTLYSVLARGTRAVFQFYPENSAQVELITQQAMKAGFGGGVVVDFPNSSKAKKMFLVLFTGGIHSQQLPRGLSDESQESNTVKYNERRDRMKKIRGKPVKRSSEWIQAKKERRRKQGKDVRPDTKYTGRKRSGVRF